MGRILARPGLNIVGVWVAAATIVLTLHSWLFEFSFLAALAALPALMLLGLAMLLTLLVLRAWTALLVFLVATGALVLLPLGQAGHQAWTRISFAQHRAAYEAVVIRAEALPVHGRFAGQSYQKDGRRIAFPRAEGVPDGWSAVVYDPSNSMPTNGEATVSVFADRTRSCIRIEQDWYRCWFD